MRRTDYWQKLRRCVMPVLVSTIVLIAAFMLNTTSSGFAAAPFSNSGQRYLIPGLLVPALNHHVPMHATRYSKKLDLSIALDIRHSGELDRLIAAQNNPRSPLFHRYITPQEFTARFAPDQSSVDAVVSYLRSQNLQVQSISPNHLLLHASGSVTDVERAFSVTLADYTVDGRIVYAPTAVPSVPAGLSGMILNVSGLDNVAHYHRLGHKSIQAHLQSSSGYTYDKIRTAYDMTPLLAHGSDGSGQTIALFELDGYNPADITTYLDHNHLGSPKFSDVLLDGATSGAGPASLEVEMDMEQVSAIAPGAAQKIYIGINTTTGVNDLYNRIVNDNIAKVVSISWGLCEASLGNAELETMSNFFRQGAAQGQAFFAASGDFGAYDCGDTNRAVDSPADDPNVVAVGGTTLRVGSDGSYLGESAWSCSFCTQRSQNGAGSGGGVSSYFSRPAYQNGPHLGGPHRQLPDVSANANPDSGYSVYCTVAAAGCPASGWVTVGGTSAAAPVWAGIAADINTYLLASGKSTLGSVNAVLYHLYNTPQPYAPYHDIIAGNNLYYQAGPGYDQATGIGTPDVWNIARDLLANTGGGLG